MDLTGVGSVADFASGLLDRFFPKEMSAEERAKVAQAMTSEIASRDQAKATIIASEMAQGDNYTKRARPTVVYAGLIMIAINYVLFPILGRLIALMKLGVDEATGKLLSTEAVSNLFTPVPLPAEFWVAWGSVVSIWVLGRSAEKKNLGGNVGKIASLITGGK